MRRPGMMKKRLAALLVTVALATGMLVASNSPAGATDPKHSFIELNQGIHGCRADVHHVTNLYAYAVAWTDNPRVPPYGGMYISCWRSAADVFYYLQWSYSGWGYFNSGSNSPYQTPVIQSQHNLCFDNSYPTYGSCMGLTTIY
jgi:hypothetical protein